MNFSDPTTLWVLLGGALGFSLILGRGAGIAYFLICFLLMSGVLIFNG